MQNKEGKVVTCEGGGLGRVVRRKGGRHLGPGVALETAEERELAASGMLFLLWLCAALRPHLFQSELGVQLNFHHRTWLGLLRDFLFPIFP